MRTPRIKSVTTLPGFKVRLEWDVGQISVVDISDIIDRYDIFAPIRENPARFDQVTIGEYGYDLHWSDLMEIPCTQLWRRSQVQAAE